MSKKRGLGRGLSALLENAETDITSGIRTEGTTKVLGSVAMIEITQIETNPFQPRSHFDQEALEELAESIKQLGIIQPITVRKMGYDRFQLISGERRYRASQMAGLTEIPAYIRIANDQAMLEMALVENIQRRDLDAIEVALSYQRLIEECKLTQEAMSERVGKKRSTITNHLRLLRLPPQVQSALRNQEITMGHARALLAIENEADMLEAFERIRSEGWSVRQVESIAKEEKQRAAPANKTLLKPLSFAQQKIKSDLMDWFGTKVDLKFDQKGKGKIEITVQSESDLQRIIEKLEA